MKYDDADSERIIALGSVGRTTAAVTDETAGYYWELKAILATGGTYLKTSLDTLVELPEAVPFI